MQLQNDTNTLALRPLERQDLRFVHELNNDAKIMRYWFEEGSTGGSATFACGAAIPSVSRMTSAVSAPNHS